MGGLFSSNKKQEHYTDVYVPRQSRNAPPYNPPVNTILREPAVNHFLREPERTTRSSITLNHYNDHYDLDDYNYYQSNESRKYINVPKVDLYKHVHNYIDAWDKTTNDNTVIFVPLPEYSEEFKDIKYYFLKTTRRNLVLIDSISRIQNPYLAGRYMIKKIKMLYIYKELPEEKLLFHGTKSININNICTNNLDWRKHGTEIGHRFGQGVSFSPISHYASHYCDKGDDKKVILVCKVLLSKTCIGDKNMKIPPYICLNNSVRYDSSQKDDGKVIVKYNDDEFYPVYKIVFTVKNSQAYFQKPKQ